MTEDVKGTEVEEKKVVITPDDAKAAFEFWHQFNVEPMPGLKEAFEQFQTKPTYENQQHLKLMVTKAITTTDHEAFKDETFAKVREECAEVSYDMQFDKQFEDVVAVDEVK